MKHHSIGLTLNSKACDTLCDGANTVSALVDSSCPTGWDLIRGVEHEARKEELIVWWLRYSAAQP